MPFCVIGMDPRGDGANRPARRLLFGTSPPRPLKTSATACGRWRALYGYLRQPTWCQKPSRCPLLQLRLWGLTIR
eukprot:11215372-Lingulodinium_polyedra.AAC.1